MAHSLHEEPLLNAFRAIANVDAAIPPHYLTALRVAVRRFAGRTWLAGRPIDCVVDHVKSMAAEAGVRESHDLLVEDAVLWATSYFYGETRLDPIPSPARYSLSGSSERTVPLEVGIDSLSGSSERTVPLEVGIDSLSGSSERTVPLEVGIDSLSGSSERTVPLEVGIDSPSGVIEELDRRDARSNAHVGERREEASLFKATHLDGDDEETSRRRWDFFSNMDYVTQALRELTKF
jgi:hypothetical protein